MPVKESCPPNEKNIYTKLNCMNNCQDLALFPLRVCMFDGVGGGGGGVESARALFDLQTKGR